MSKKPCITIFLVLCLSFILEGCLRPNVKSVNDLSEIDFYDKIAPQCNVKECSIFLKKCESQSSTDCKTKFDRCLNNSGPRCAVIIGCAQKLFMSKHVVKSKGCNGYMCLGDVSVINDRYVKKAEATCH